MDMPQLSSVYGRSAIARRRAPTPVRRNRLVRRWPICSGAPVPDARHQSRPQHQRAGQAGHQHQHAVHGGGGQARGPRPARRRRTSRPPHPPAAPSRRGSAAPPSPAAPATPAAPAGSADRSPRRSGRRSGRCRRARPPPTPRAAAPPARPGGSAAGPNRATEVAGTSEPVRPVHGAAIAQPADQQAGRQQQPDPRHCRMHRRTNERTAPAPPAHLHQLAGHPVPGHRAHPAGQVAGDPAVPDRPVHIAEHAAGQRAVQQLRAVAGGDRGRQREPDAQAGRDQPPPPGRADRSQRGQHARRPAASSDRSGAGRPAPGRCPAARAARPGCRRRPATAASASSTSASFRTRGTRPAGWPVQRAWSSAGWASSVSSCPIRCAVSDQPVRVCPSPGRRPPQPVAQLGIGQPAPQRVGQRVRVTGPDQQAGRRIAERLRHPADRGGEHRQPAGQRLGHHHAVGLAVGRQHQQVGTGVGGGQLRSGAAGQRSRIRSAMPAETACRRSRAASPGPGPGCPPSCTASAGRPAGPAPPADRGPCRGSARRRTAAGAGRGARRRPRPDRRRARRPARVRRSHGYSASSCSRVQSLVVSTARAAPSTAASPIGSAGRQSLGPEPERQVHQHHQPQPGRGRHQHGRQAAGDQAVQQHQRAVRDAGQPAGHRPPRWRPDVASHRPAWCSMTCQPAAASSRQTRRS